MERILLLVIGVLFISSTAFSQNNRTFDGTQNNLQNPNWGASHSQLQRLTTPSYSDGIASPGGTTRPNPRTISNTLFAQDDLINDPLNLSDYIWVFGQFIDHDITLTGDGNEFAMIPVPAGDPWFDPFGQGTAMIFMSRSEEMEGTGTDINNPRQHPNEITAWLDASNVYGSDVERANWLRTFSGGKMKVSYANLLPFNTLSSNYATPIDPNAPEMDDPVQISNYHFVAGDVRANENPLLAAFHTLFVREHNRLCDELIEKHPTWTDEELYQYARKMVGGQIQNIVYSEWLPTMGLTLPAYSGYDPSINAGIFNVFSGAAFRMGHTLLNSVIRRLDNEGNEIPAGNLLLQEAFFNPLSMIWSGGGIDPLFKGMATQTEQNLDCKVINDVRNFLFGPPGAGGLDLAAININRGRERGLPDFNTVRSDFGLTPYSSFLELTGNADEAANMEALYGSINDVDAWVGMLAEKHISEALFGETIMEILEQQFFMLREGDRFYFENDPVLTQAEKEEIKGTRLFDVLMRNTNITLMQEKVFEAMPHENICNPAMEGLGVVGSIAIESGGMLENVELLLDDGTVGLSNVNGTFDLVAENCQTHLLTLNKDDYDNGVTTLDIVFIQKDILGIEALDSPFKKIAADINRSGTITTFDIVKIRRLILGLDETFIESPSWQFFPSDFTFDNIDEPFATVLPDNTFEVSLSNGMIEMDFFAIKMGDMDFSATPDDLIGAADTRTKDTWTLTTEDREMEIGEEIEISLASSITMNLQGTQFTLNYDVDALEFVDIESVTLTNFTDENFAWFEDEGALTLSWNGKASIEKEQPVINFLFKTKEKTNLSDQLSINSRITKAEAYSNVNELLDVDLSFINANELVVNSEMKLYQNRPNPFSGSTTIGFELPAMSEVELTVFDLSGKALITIQRAFEKGYQEINIEGKIFPAKGIYYYQLQSEFGTETRKMIFTK